MKKKIYMAGVGGMLGEAFYKVFNRDFEVKCTDKDVNAEWLTFLDFRDYDAYRKDVLDFQPDYLFHIGAYTDLEYCEREVDDCYRTNTLSVEHAVHIANELNIPLLYISTAGIYDGKQETYDDWDIPNPLGHYARSKYMGELFVRENTRKHLVCRAGWMMGAGPAKDKKFIQKLMRQLKSGADELFIVNDKLGTPTFTMDFANNARLLLEKEMWGVYNMVCGGTTGRLEVARELLHILGLESKVRIQEVSSEYYKEIYFAQRPASERLINKKLNLRGMNVMRDWKVCLREYVDGYYKDYLNAE